MTSAPPIAQFDFLDPRFQGARMTEPGQAWADLRTLLVSGFQLTWYGPSLVTAGARLSGGIRGEGRSERD